MTEEQKRVLKKLNEIDKELRNGVSLTFAVDNQMETMDEDNRKKFAKVLYELIKAEYLTTHTDKKTANGVPFWLEFTGQGRKYIEEKCA